MQAVMKYIKKGFNTVNKSLEIQEYASRYVQIKKVSTALKYLLKPSCWNTFKKVFSILFKHKKMIVILLKGVHLETKNASHEVSIKLLKHSDNTFVRVELF